MRFATAMILGLLATPALAQQASPPPPVVVPYKLANAIHIFLRDGGTRAQADQLADDLDEAAAGPAKEAETRRRIEDELKARAPPAPAINDAHPPK